MFCGFLYLFMEKPDNRKRNVICFLLFSTVMFGILLYSSLVEYYMIINDLMFLAVLEIYSILCLRGNIFSRIFMPLIAFLINTVISFAFSYFVSFFTGYTHYELVTEPTIYRYICIVVINLTDVLVFSMLVKFKNHKVNLRKITDVIAFIILPVIVLLIVYCTFYIMVITKYEANIMVYLSVICLCMITVTAIVWYAVSRISRENEASTKLLLMEQQTSVYKGYKQDKIEMRGDRAEMSDFPLYLNTVAGGLDCRDQTIGGFSFVVKIYAVPVIEIIG